MHDGKPDRRDRLRLLARERQAEIARCQCPKRRFALLRERNELLAQLRKASGDRSGGLEGPEGE